MWLRQRIRLRSNASDRLSPFQRYAQVPGSRIQYPRRNLRGPRPRCSLEKKEPVQQRQVLEKRNRGTRTYHLRLGRRRVTSLIVEELYFCRRLATEEWRHAQSRDRA